MIDPSLITSVDPPLGGDHLNIQISPCGTKIWVCIDGANVFRYRNLKGLKMKLYITTATYRDDDGSTIATVMWSGTQADARGDKKSLKDLGSKDAAIKPVNVPTDKAGLLDWLNNNRVGA